MSRFIVALMWARTLDRKPSRVSKNKAASGPMAACAPEAACLKEEVLRADLGGGDTQDLPIH